MSKGGLVSPRGRGPALSDLGQRGGLIARQRLARAHRHRWRRAARTLALVGAGLLVLAVQVAGVAWLLTTDYFGIRVVEVRGTSRVSPDRVLAAAEIPVGTNFWRLDGTAVRARIEALPEIRRAELIREFPNRVVILVEERRPFTLVHGARLHWIDEDGRVLGEERDAVASPAPVITGLSEEEVAAMRTRPSPRARAAIALIRALLRSGSPLASQISEIDMSRRDGPVLYTVGGIEVRLGDEEWEQRLARLEGVLAQVGGQNTTVSAIDLRYRDQVILKRGGRG
ncbi:MAG TPA: FtsQ-type POTRA domain-containing protein [Methylomirabilota bacterium]|nr:FtsQ-type POTRA domain-containing protein [Methylomirabilota bacterium]